jgi:hypothetical protein
MSGNVHHDNLYLLFDSRPKGTLELLDIVGVIALSFSGQIQDELILHGIG